MQLELTSVINGEIFCVYCAKKLTPGEECACKASQKARQKAARKAREAEHKSPDHKFDRPPRRQAK